MRSARFLASWMPELSLPVLSLLSLLLPSLASAQSISVELPEGIKATGDGRVVIFLIREGTHRREEPVDSPFFEDPQPVFGLNVTKAVLERGTPIDIPADTQGFLGAKKGWGPLSKLEPGSYRIQAGVIFTTIGGGGQWQRIPGNLLSKESKAKLPLAAPLTLQANTAAKQPVWPANAKGVELFEMKSKLLSDFAGREVVLRAGVRLPTKMTGGNRKYAALYEVPGFGGDHFGALHGGPGRTGADRTLRENVFYVCLDPNNENGHTFFLDSDNNGPWGKALTEEFIPALEAKYPLLKTPEARLLRGHSSGGWSTLWLATEYPQVFAATWSSSPDPVDFRKFENFSLYDRKNLYTDDAGQETPSQRHGATIDMTTRDENSNEHAIGPDRTSGQQWASWQACWGTRTADGKIAALYDPITGAIDPAERDTYRRFDLVERLKKDPARLLPLYRDHVRLFVGTMDNYYLNEAVELLQAELAKLDPKHTGSTPDHPGYVRFVPDVDHSSIYNTMQMIGVAGEMVEHLRVSAPDALPKESLPVKEAPATSQATTRSVGKP